MTPLTHLAIIWAGVFVAVVAAKKTRLTPVLYFLFIGSALANTGILPTESGAFIRSFAELGIIFIMFALGFHPAVGAYRAGLIVGEEHFQLRRRKAESGQAHGSENVYNETKRIVDTQHSAGSARCFSSIWQPASPAAY